MASDGLSSLILAIVRTERCSMSTISMVILLRISLLHRSIYERRVVPQNLAISFYQEKIVTASVLYPKQKKWMAGEGKRRDFESGKRFEEITPPPPSADPEMGEEGLTWTREQDANIIEIKVAKSTWNQAPSAVGASKSDFQNRFKEFQAFADDYVTAKFNEAKVNATKQDNKD
ncbi:hypothetical protein BDZ45DRAFT_749103 [Acephala macrosclerotiorum]|nr:hypothetical protein BDZ45DRAFT_749103 [Acephala macrosclerotiorum]